MKIKTAELFCASPASTAICTTMNQHAMVRRGSLSTPRPINHRHHDYYNNHYQFDFGDKPKFKTPTIPCTSQQHIDPKPYTFNLQKSRKSTSTTIGKSTSSIDNVMLTRRKSSVEFNDRDTTTCGSSSRRLLNSNRHFFEDLKEKESGSVINAGALVVSEPVWLDYSHDDASVIKKSLLSRRVRGDELVESRSSSIRLDLAKVESPRLKSSRSKSRDQVVELRVSIHCKGCEGKVRKHLSRMEGVRSFQIDLESKKVTVVGDVTPSSVLSSISKVKNAQLWPPPPPSSPFIAIEY